MRLSQRAFCEESGDLYRVHHRSTGTRTRGGYQTQLFERYHRRRSDLDQTIGEMFIGGISKARVGEVVETLTGSKPSASTVFLPACAWSRCKGNAGG